MFSYEELEIYIFRAFEQRKLLAAREVNEREERERAHGAKTYGTFQGKVGRHRDNRALNLALRQPGQPGQPGHPWYGDGDVEENWHHSFMSQPAKK